MTKTSNVSCETFSESLLSRGLFQNSKESLSFSRDCLLYWDEFNGWNKVHNLSTIKNLDDAIDLHFIDSLYPTLFKKPFLNARKVLDLGTGGGFPGIPLSIYFKNINFYLLDKSRKKTSFLQYASAKLNYKNVFPIHIDFFKDSEVYDVIVSRAVRIDKEILEKARSSVSKGGWLIVYRTKNDIPLIGLEPNHSVDYTIRNKKRTILFYQF